jgi:hypothetical protein
MENTTEIAELEMEKKRFEEESRLREAEVALKQEDSTT